MCLSTLQVPTPSVEQKAVVQNNLQFHFNSLSEYEKTVIQLAASASREKYLVSKVGTRDRLVQGGDVSV